MEEGGLDEEVSFRCAELHPNQGSWIEITPPGGKI